MELYYTEEEDVSDFDNSSYYVSFIVGLVL